MKSSVEGKGQEFKLKRRLAKNACFRSQARCAATTAKEGVCLSACHRRCELLPVLLPLVRPQLFLFFCSFSFVKAAILLIHFYKND